MSGFVVALRIVNIEGIAATFAFTSVTVKSRLFFFLCPDSFGVPIIRRHESFPFVRYWKIIEPIAYCCLESLFKLSQCTLEQSMPRNEVSNSLRVVDNKFCKSRSILPCAFVECLRSKNVTAVGNDPAS
jgi:hypothetical protein